MSNYEILKNAKNSYESILELLQNIDVSFEDNKILKKSLDSLERIYNLTYSNMLKEKENLKTDARCRRCQSDLLISDNINYSYQCTECDENYYDFEVDTNKVWYEKGLDEDKKLNYGEKYSIEIWETEWHRDAGEGYIYDETFESYDAALITARKLFEDYNYASIEIVNSDNEALYCRDDESEDFYFEDERISCVSPEIINEYIYNYNNKKEQKFTNNRLYCVENGIYVAIDDSTGNCWTEEFKSEKEAQNWLLNKELEKGGIEI